jgi:hypothetical protein
MHETTPSPDELNWQAFRYIAGEMNATEQERFEQLLAEDQPARQAVAAAVELSQASVLALGMSQPPVWRAPVWGGVEQRHRWMGWVVGVAACLALVAAWLAQREAPVQSASLQSEALALQWSEVREQQHELADAALADPSPESILSTDEPEPLDAWPLADDNAAVAPDWMLAAVFEQRELGDSEESQE